MNIRKLPALLPEVLRNPRIKRTFWMSRRIALHELLHGVQTSPERIIRQAFEFEYPPNFILLLLAEHNR
jgi:hypothetical protein